MEKTRFTEAQIVATLKTRVCIPFKEICRELAISDVTFYTWKSKYGGLESSDVSRLKDLEEENSRLNRIFAELIMDHSILKDVISKKAGALQAKGSLQKRLGFLYDGLKRFHPSLHPFAG